MRQKVTEWLWRYGPAEIASLPATIIPALAVHAAGGSALATALAGTWGGNIGYFGTILSRDVYVTRQRLQAAGRRYGSFVFAKNVRALLIEFGLAEAFDSLLVRPLLMYYLPAVTGSLGWGILLAKLAADVSFYLPAILFYEWSKSRYRKF